MLYLTHMGMPPPPDTLSHALSLPGFHLHAGSPWRDIIQNGNTIQVTTPHTTYEFDFLIAGTGTITDLSLRPELALIHPYIATWQDRYIPAAEDRHADMARAPYLGPYFEHQEKIQGTAPYLNGLFNFTFGAMVSHGTSGSAIHGIKYSVPKIVSGITRQLFIEDREFFYESMRQFSITEFDLESIGCKASSHL